MPWFFGFWWICFFDEVASVFRTEKINVWMKVLKNEQDKTTKLLKLDISYKGKGKNV